LKDIFGGFNFNPGPDIGIEDIRTGPGKKSIKDWLLAPSNPCILGSEDLRGVSE